VSRWPISWYDDLAEKMDRKWGWDKLPLPIAMPVLIGLRNILREKNLYDTGRGPLDRPSIDDSDSSFAAQIYPKAGVKKPSKAPARAKAPSRGKAKKARARRR
jgi:hypothetical protein